MILIKNIEYVTVDRDPIEIISLDETRMTGRCRVNNGRESVNATFMTEYVHGRTFVRPDGEVLNIGVSKKVGDILGIQFECWDRMEKDLHEMTKDMFTIGIAKSRVEQKLARYEKAGFWKRLIYAFNGVMD